MNRAQALRSLGHGRYEWRDDLILVRKRCAGVRLRKSVLVFELERMQAALAHPLPEQPKRMARDEVRAFASRAIELLQQVRDRLDFGQICQRLAVQDTKSRTLRRVMDRLCGDGSVHSDGTYRKVYWIE